MIELPAANDPQRKHAIRSAHLQCRKLGSTSFAMSATRIGISEAELIYAHEAVCPGIRQISLNQHRFWDIFCHFTEHWYVQVGNRHGAIKINDDIQNIYFGNNQVAIHGEGWHVALDDLDLCHAFVTRCQRSNGISKISICDPQGRLQLFMMPLEHEQQMQASYALYEFAHAAENLVHENEILPCASSKHSWSSHRKKIDYYIDQCHNQDIPINIQYIGPLICSLEGSITGAHHNGRESSWHIQQQQLMLHHDTLHECRFQALGYRLESEQLCNDYSWQLAIPETSKATTVVRWMELIESVKCTS